MFTAPLIARLARHAHKLTEGSGGGHTEYPDVRTARRYVVGGCRPSLMFPIGTPAGVIRAAVQRMVEGVTDAETLGCWEDQGTVYVDLGNTFDGVNMALYAAQRRGELAIFDRGTGECITVPAPRPLAPCYCDSAYHPQGC